MKSRVISGLSLALLCSSTGLVFAVEPLSPQAIESGFKTPPDSAKPRVWWHWMSGNVTKEGITADLEWMKRSGIAGFQMFDAYLGVPQFVEKRLVWYTPEWKDAFHHAAAEADRLGLEMAMAGSGGWSESGGPSVKPEEAMKKLVWSETSVEGGQTFSGVLRSPPTNNGLFQDAPPIHEPDRPGTTDLPGAKPAVARPAAAPDPTYYADTAVLAYRVPVDDVSMKERKPKVSWNGEAADLAGLTDGSFAENVRLPFPDKGGDGVLTFEFAEPYRAQAFTIASVSRIRNGQRVPIGTLQSSQDGSAWTTLVTFPPAAQTERGCTIRTFSFSPVTAKLFRVVLSPPPVDYQTAMFAQVGYVQKEKPISEIAEVELHGGPRVNRWEDKAGFGLAMDYDAVPTPAVPANQVIAPADVVDLTAKMSKDGTLKWNVPPGRWIIARYGYSLHGTKNHPATPEATGFEVDKLSRKNVESFFDYYVSQAANAAGSSFGKSFRYLLLDSWEAGVPNWTDTILADFRERRGYDALPWLPVLTGRVIGSADLSDRFLWDWRRTIADLVADNHYGAAAELLHKRGAGLYAEAVGTNRPTLGDGLQDKGRADIPMGEFWVPPAGETDAPNYVADVREAASAGHIYGKPIVAAESFTSRPNVLPWGQSPYQLKALGDRNLAAGINRIVFHTSDHQPFVDDAHKPGMTLWMFGQHYSRNITWAEQAIAWNTYLARSSFLLQQGLFSADIAYFYGEGAPVVAPYWKEQIPAVPAGYNYDYLNAEVLLSRVSVKDGRIVLPDGMSYRILVLPAEANRLTLPVLRKLRDLVAAGAVVVAPRPLSSPSLTGYPASDEEELAIANDVWGAVDGLSINEHVYGKGKVFWGVPLDTVLTSLKTLPDFQYTHPKLDTQLVWIHRHVGEMDLYFVANQKERPENVEAVFRVDGREAELWHPETGMIEPASYTAANGSTTVPLQFDPYGSVFVVFRTKASASSRQLPKVQSTVVATLAGPWTVSFPPKWGAPALVTLEKLVSWPEHSDPGVKYFSGTATYMKTIEVPAVWLKQGTSLKLDLGRVKEIAEVSVNGTPLKVILWKPPFAVDVTRLLKAGSNQIEIKVTNLWPNRIIGDQALPIDQRHTFTVYHAFKADSPLLESGMMGPVTLSRESTP